MRECITPRRAFRSLPERRILKEKWEKQKRCQLLKLPSSKGSCTLSSCRGRATPTGAQFSPFFYLERKKQWVCCCSSRASLPTAGRGCHCPPGLQKQFWHRKEDKVKVVPAGTTSVWLKALNTIPCYPESGPRRMCGCFLQLWRREEKWANNTERCWYRSDSLKQQGLPQQV